MLILRIIVAQFLNFFLYVHVLKIQSDRKRDRNYPTAVSFS